MTGRNQTVVTHHSSTQDRRLPTVSLHIGDVHAASSATKIKTVLGSCISACMFDPTTGIGGMNHFLLPGDVNDAELSTRYGVNAMEVLINEMMKAGANRLRLRAKVFGGADIFQANHPLLMVGKKNIAFVRQFLDTESIPIDRERLGGTSGLIVHFHTNTYEVFVKAVSSGRFQETGQEEELFQSRITEDLRKQTTKNITIF